jgi:hypothetical protein
MTCSALGLGLDGDPSSATPNWSAWPSPKSCSAVLRATLAALCPPPARASVPYLPTQSAYNKRLRAAGHLVCLALEYLAQRTPSRWDQLRLLDSTALPCAASRETVKRSALWGLAGYGYCKSHHRWFWGLRLYLLATPDGMPVAWCLATPKLGEREVAQALLRPRDVHPGRQGLCRAGLRAGRG